MRLLGLDLGTKKCGVAITDPMQIIASPLMIIFYENKDFNYLINEIKKIIEEKKPIEKVILGITKNIDGTLSNMGKIVMKFYEQLKNEIQIKVVLIDEKNTSKDSEYVMSQMNLKNKKKKEFRDAIAAQKILENYLLNNQN